MIAKAVLIFKSALAFFHMKKRDEYRAHRVFFAN